MSKDIHLNTINGQQTSGLNEIVPDFNLHFAAIQKEFAECMNSLKKEVDLMEVSHIEITNNFLLEVRTAMTALHLIQENRQVTGQNSLEKVEQFITQLQSMRELVREFTEQTANLLELALNSFKQNN